MKPSEFLITCKRGAEKDTLGSTDVRFNDRSLDLHLEIINHSPTGFNWGYGGSGPSQLALAILYEFAQHVLGVNDQGAREFTMENYQKFKWDYVSKIPAAQDWEISGTTIFEWMGAK